MKFVCICLAMIRVVCRATVPFLFDSGPLNNIFVTHSHKCVGIIVYSSVEDDQGLFLK